MSKSRLHQLSELGQSVWIDYLSRDMIHGGELERMMKEDAVVGVTSNPTIFQKAISQGSAYDDQLRELLEEHCDSVQAFFQLAERDVGDACDLLRSFWEQTAGRDGYVSIEVDPNLAYETEATFEQAKELHDKIDRPNLLVKIPATEPGLPAIEDSIAAGRSINITLTFSLDRYKAVVEAYQRGIERLIGPETVNTMPEETIQAFQDHGEVAETLTKGVEDAKRVFDELRQVGVDYADVVAVLEQEGVEKFSDSFAELIEGIKSKRGELVSA